MRGLSGLRIIDFGDMNVVTGRNFIDFLGRFCFGFVEIR